MLAHKNITRLVAAVMVLAVCLCLCAAGFSDKIKAAAGDTGVSMAYESELFGTDGVITVNIIMDEDNWNDMLQNAVSEEYYKCDVEINGTMFYQVAIRPKGNTSLSAIASDPTTDRYSFKLEFDHYVDGQTCFGLDKLVLNNNYADATNMKEALIYDMFQYLGADASLYNYAKISVNGEYWGVYLALEAVEDSFLLRNYGAQSGALYKPEGVNGGGDSAAEPGAGFGDMQPSAGSSGQYAAAGGMTPPGNGGSAPSGSPGQPPDGFSGQQGDAPDGTAPQDMPAGGGEQAGGAAPGMNGASGGADLNYTDDDPDSYQNIWDGEIGSTSDADHERVISALRSISEGSGLEDAMDIDNLLRYMAVHVFSVNEDSLSGNMAHNYYLYESDGRLNIIPWDYNLALGGMGGGDADSVVNSAIDDAFTGTTFFDTLMDDESYHSRYYAYLRQLVTEYVNGGGFDAFYERVRSQIDELVKTDPTAFYDYEEYKAAAETLYQTVKLRAESIEGQLDGSIPSTAAEQRGSDALVDASSIDLSVMGQMNNGGGDFKAEAGGDGAPAAFAMGSTPAAPGAGQAVAGDNLSGGTGESASDSAAGQQPPGNGAGNTASAGGGTGESTVGSAAGQQPPGNGAGNTAPADGGTGESASGSSAGQQPPGNGAGNTVSADGGTGESTDGSAAGQQPPGNGAGNTASAGGGTGESSSDSAAGQQPPGNGAGNTASAGGGTGESSSDSAAGQQPPGNGAGNAASAGGVSGTLILYALSFLIVLAALAFAALHKKRRMKV